MRTGPSLTELNNRMILFEYERALRKGNGALADRIVMVNPQIPSLRFAIGSMRARIDTERSG